MEFSDTLIVWYASFKSHSGKKSHLKLLNIPKAALIKEKTKLTLCNLLFKNLKSVMILLTFEFFLAISSMVEEYCKGAECLFVDVEC